MGPHSDNEDRYIHSSFYAGYSNGIRQSSLSSLSTPSVFGGEGLSRYRSNENSPGRTSTQKRTVRWKSIPPFLREGKQDEGSHPHWEQSYLIAARSSSGESAPSDEEARPSTLWGAQRLLRNTSSSSSSNSSHNQRYHPRGGRRTRSKLQMIATDYFTYPTAAPPGYYGNTREGMEMFVHVESKRAAAAAATAASVHSATTANAQHVRGDPDGRASTAAESKNEQKVDPRYASLLEYDLSASLSKEERRREQRRRQLIAQYVYQEEQTRLEEERMMEPSLEVQRLIQTSSRGVRVTPSTRVENSTMAEDDHDSGILIDGGSVHAELSPRRSCLRPARGVGFLRRRARDLACINPLGNHHQRHKEEDEMNDRHHISKDHGDDDDDPYDYDYYFTIGDNGARRHSILANATTVIMPTLSPSTAPFNAQLPAHSVAGNQSRTKKQELPLQLVPSRSNSTASTGSGQSSSDASPIAADPLQGFSCMMLGGSADLNEDSYVCFDEALGRCHALDPPGDSYCFADDDENSAEEAQEPDNLCLANVRDLQFYCSGCASRTTACPRHTKDSGDWIRQVSKAQCLQDLTIITSDKYEHCQQQPQPWQELLVLPPEALYRIWERACQDEEKYKPGKQQNEFQF